MPGLHGGLRLNARFTLVRSIGTGGMGEVWVIRDRELDEEIAAKILPPGTPEDLVALLRRECSNARRLLHPNIVPVFDFHRGDDGHSFITMARVDGQDAGSLRGHELLPSKPHALRSCWLPRRGNTRGTPCTAPGKIGFLVTL